MIEMSVDKETVVPSECPGHAPLASPPQKHPDLPDKRTANPQHPFADSKQQDGSCSLSDGASEEPEDHGTMVSDFSTQDGVQQPRAQPRLGKRHGSFKHPAFGKRRRQANSESESVLPTNFLMGGNIFDPLNLNSLLDEEVNRALNAETPKSSPLPAKNRDPVEILIPRDITDPLNLNVGTPGDGGVLLAPLRSGGGGRRRHRNRHHGGTGIQLGDLPEVEKGPCLDCDASEAQMEEALESNSVPSQEAPSPSDQRPKSTGGQGVKDERLTSTPVLENSNPAPSAPAPHRQRKRKRTTSRSENFGAPYCNKTRAPSCGPEPEKQGTGLQAQQQRPNHRKQQKNQQNPNNQQHRQKKKFQYGNYDKYYGYRNPGLSEDPRLGLLRPEWFEGKEVLDLGCNSGRITLSIASNWQPSRIVGMDIDGALIHAARKNILYFLSEMQVLKARSGKKDTSGELEKEPEKMVEVPAAEVERTDQSGASLEGEDGVAGEKGAEEKVVVSEELSQEPGEMVDRSEDGDAKRASSSSSGSYLFPVSLCISRGPIAAPPLPEAPPPSPRTFPANVSFVKGNYVLDSDSLLVTQRAEFDVILCLSVTKWVHLNWGDSGLKRLFQRVFLHLRPGGLFILEPQPWPSYSRRKKLSEIITKNYYSICLKPEHFSTYLTSEVGFSSYELIGTSNNSSRGFQRPIYVFHKAPPPRP